MPPFPSESFLKVENLKVYFPLRQSLWKRSRHFVKAVDSVSFEVQRGKITGIVGESGSGKTTLGQAIINLVPLSAGRIWYDGQPLDSPFPHRMRKKIQMIFQDPSQSLNPRMRIEHIVVEPLEIHFKQLRRAQKRERVAALLGRVGLSPDFMQRYPHQFSGGQRQRIGIARALAVEPELIICDEPTSALDVSVQAEIVNLLQDLQSESGLTYLFISHDLALVEHVSDEVLVMKDGKIVEQASAQAIYSSPQHEYTKKLLAAVPGLDFPR